MARTVTQDASDWRTFDDVVVSALILRLWRGLLKLEIIRSLSIVAGANEERNGVDMRIHLLQRRTEKSDECRCEPNKVQSGEKCARLSSHPFASQDRWLRLLGTLSTAFYVER